MRHSKSTGKHIAPGKRIPWHKWPNPTMVFHLVAMIWIVQVFGPQYVFWN